MSKADFLRKKNKWLPKIHAWIKDHGGGTLIPFSVEFEQELHNIKDVSEKENFLKESAIQSILPKIISTGYKELNLIYFFTAGEKEVRGKILLFFSIRVLMYKLFAACYGCV